MRLAGSKKILAELAELGGNDQDAVTLMPEDPEDMWHADNLISPDDILRAHAIRKVTRTSHTGSTTSERVHTDLTIRVTSTFFDPAASALHVSGTVVLENGYVSLGQYHTLDLELNRPFTILKPHGWDSVAAETLKEALRQDTADALAAVVMQEGLANICLITDSRTLLKQRVEHAVPKKRSAAPDTDSGMRAFFDKTLSTLLRAINFTEEPRTLLLASPGFVAAGFRKHIQDQAARQADKMLAQMARDSVVVHSSSGHVHALNEVLRTPEVAARLTNTRAGAETKLMDDLYRRLRLDDGRAWYGVKPVSRAVEDGAVGPGGGVLLVNNSLFRNQDPGTRRKYVRLVDKVKQAGGDARILSSDHESGQRLDALGGIAAILTFPVFDLDEEDEDAEDGDPAGESAEGVAVI